MVEVSKPLARGAPESEPPGKEYVACVLFYIRPNIFLVEQALQGNLVIPDFKEFCDEIDQMFRKSIENRAGEIAHYIPQLARVNPESYGVALCTIDGQRWAMGDSNVDFSVQSSCKPINYCLALEEHGEDFVHGFVGREPSGRIFNELTLSEDGKPHNPMINAGAIMSSALIRQDLDNADRFDYVLSRWRALCGEQRVGFNNAVYQSERHTADRNFALAITCANTVRFRQIPTSWNRWSSFSNAAPSR